MVSKASPPHSWSIKDWPLDVYPNSPDKARYLTRSKRDELISAGALVRIGRELVIIGEPYVRWMKKKAVAVPDYRCPANKDRDAA